MTNKDDCLESTLHHNIFILACKGINKKDFSIKKFKNRRGSHINLFSESNQSINNSIVQSLKME